MSETLTPKQKAARERLKHIPDNRITNPPNRKSRRDLEKLFIDAGFEDEVLEAQRKIWDKNKKKPTVKNG